MKSALLVIDYQNAVFIEPAAWRADIVLERIRQMIARARAAAVPVIFIQHGDNAAGSPWAAGSPTWAFPEAIAPRPGDFVSPKSSCDAFRHSALEDHLKEQGITQVFLCGYATEFCIDTNVRRAASLELATVVVADAHTTRDRPHLAAEAIIEHHNWVWDHFDIPGNSLSLCLADEVHFVKESG